jgi:hypothetical protein
MTDPAADPGERVLLLEELQGLVIATVTHQGDKALDADMGRTGGLARGGPPFGYAEGPGDSLWILLENRFTEIKQFVVFVGTGNRTDLGALAAARAFGHVHISGFLVNSGGEIAGLAFETQKFGIREKLNIQVTADLDQFR